MYEKNREYQEKSFLRVVLVLLIASDKSSEKYSSIFRGASPRGTIDKRQAAAPLALLDLLPETLERAYLPSAPPLPPYLPQSATHKKGSLKRGRGSTAMPQIDKNPSLLSPRQYHYILQNTSEWSVPEKCG